MMMAEISRDTVEIIRKILFVIEFVEINGRRYVGIAGRDSFEEI